jgi:hypothetical protein
MEMTGRIPARVATFAAAALAMVALAATMAGSASAATTVYSNLPSPMPGNVVSVGFEARSTAEFGGLVEFSAAAKNPTITVGMSSWSCQSGGAEDGTCVSAPGATYSWPITLDIYEAGPGNSVGAKLVTLTQTFAIPYRPSADNVKCVGNGGWSKGKSCFHGKLFKIKFSKLGTNKAPVTLPSKAIVSVAYNTTDHGYVPTGVPGPEDSLNVGIAGNATVGGQPAGDSVFQNSTFAGFYCDGGEAGTGTFRLDAGCWTEEQPIIQVQSH